MTKFQDRFTGKVFTVKGNKVIDSFGNVATISAKEWIAMQGEDVIKLELIKTRAKSGLDLDGKMLNRGKVFMYVSCSTETLAEKVAEEMKSHGYETDVMEDSDKFDNGSELLFVVDSGDLADFNAAYKEVKKTVC